MPQARRALLATDDAPDPPGVCLVLSPRALVRDLQRAFELEFPLLAGRARFSLAVARVRYLRPAAARAVCDEHPPAHAAARRRARLQTLSAGVHAALATPFEKALTLRRPRYVQLPLHNLAAADLTVLAEDPSVLAADAAVFAFELTVSSE